MGAVDASDAYSALCTAIHDAGLLPSMRIRQTPSGPRIWIEGLTPDAAVELAMTIEAGVEARTVRA